MKFTIDRHEKYVVITPHEKMLDSSTSPQIKSEFIVINSDGQRNSVLDLCEVEDADASGLRSALTAHRMCKAAGGIFVIASANEKILNLIEMSKLSDVLVTVPTISEAVDLIFMEELEKEFRGQPAIDRNEI